MIGVANPNPACCSSCGGEGPVESFVLYRFELICAGCYESHEAARRADGCSDCVAKGVPLEETAAGDLLCIGCVQAANVREAERADKASNTDYYGGSCSAETYARNDRRQLGEQR